MQWKSEIKERDQQADQEYTKRRVKRFRNIGLRGFIALTRLFGTNIWNGILTCFLSLHFLVLFSRAITGTLHAIGRLSAGATASSLQTILVSPFPLFCSNQINRMIGITGIIGIVGVSSNPFFPKSMCVFVLVFVFVFVLLVILTGQLGASFAALRRVRHFPMIQ